MAVYRKLSSHVVLVQLLVSSQEQKVAIPPTDIQFTSKEFENPCFTLSVIVSGNLV